MSIVTGVTTLGNLPVPNTSQNIILDYIDSTGIQNKVLFSPQTGLAITTTTSGLLGTMQLSLLTNGTLTAGTSPVQPAIATLSSDVTVPYAYTVNPVFSSTTPIYTYTYTPSVRGAPIKITVIVPWGTSVAGTASSIQVLCYYANPAVYNLINFGGDTCPPISNSNAMYRQVSFDAFIPAGTTASGNNVNIYIGATVGAIGGSNPIIYSTNSANVFSGLNPFQLIIKELPLNTAGSVSLAGSSTVTSTPVPITGSIALNSPLSNFLPGILQTVNIAKVYPNTLLRLYCSATIQRSNPGNDFGAMIGMWIAPTGTSNTANLCLNTIQNTYGVGSGSGNAVGLCCSSGFISGGASTAGNFTATIAVGQQQVGVPINSLCSSAIIYETDPNGSSGTINFLATGVINGGPSTSTSSVAPVPYSSTIPVTVITIPCKSNGGLMEFDFTITAHEISLGQAGEIFYFYLGTNLATPIQTCALTYYTNTSGANGFANGRVFIQVPTTGQGTNIVLTIGSLNLYTVAQTLFTWNGFYEEIFQLSGSASSTAGSSSNVSVGISNAESPVNFVSVPLPANVAVTTAYTNGFPALSAMQTVLTTTYTTKIANSIVNVQISAQSSTPNTSAAGIQLCLYLNLFSATIPVIYPAISENGAMTTASLDNTVTSELIGRVTQNNPAGTTMTLTLAASYTQASGIVVQASNFIFWITEEILGTQSLVQSIPIGITSGQTIAATGFNTGILAQMTTIGTASFTKMFPNSYLAISGSFSVEGTVNNSAWGMTTSLFLTGAPITIFSSGAPGAGLVATRVLFDQVMLNYVWNNLSSLAAGSYTLTVACGASVQATTTFATGVGYTPIYLFEYLPYASSGTINTSTFSLATTTASLVVGTKTPPLSSMTTISTITVKTLSALSKVLYRCTVAASGPNNPSFEILVAVYVNGSNTTPYAYVPISFGLSTVASGKTKPFIFSIPSSGTQQNQTVTFAVASLTTGQTASNATVNVTAQEVLISSASGLTTTFTPNLVAATTAGTVTYVSRGGFVAWQNYNATLNLWMIIIGVSITFYTTGSVGNLSVTGIPVSVTSNSVTYNGNSLSPSEYITLPGSPQGGPQATIAYPQSNPSTVLLQYNNNGGAPSPITAAMCSTASATPTRIAFNLLSFTTQTPP